MVKALRLTRRARHPRAHFGLPERGVRKRIGPRVGVFARISTPRISGVADHADGIRQRVRTKALVLKASFILFEVP